jgi:nucleotide-binding universal stress UspA family protein
MYKTIVVQVDQGAAMEARLQGAARLAHIFDAHLIGCAATGLSWPAYALVSASMAVAPVDEFDALRAQARASLRRFGERARALGVPAVEECLVEDDERQALLLQSRYADLVVASVDPDGAGTLRGVPQYVALHGARPVLVLPPTYAGAALDTQILVAWDGGVQALRAISAALPLLLRAERVCVAVINPDSEPALHGEEPGADMARYLARHGVRVDVVVERSRASVGAALLELAQKQGAGLLVAGAFGHSRYRELILGGVTRLLLQRATLPLLLTH